MSDDTAAQGDRSLVRIAKSDRGRTWSVSVRVGDELAELEEAYAIARQIEQKLSENDQAPRIPAES